MFSVVYGIWMYYVFWWMAYGCTMFSVVNAYFYISIRTVVIYFYVFICSLVFVVEIFLVRHVDSLPSLDTSNVQAAGYQLFREALSRHAFQVPHPTSFAHSSCGRWLRSITVGFLFIRCHVTLDVVSSMPKANILSFFLYLILYHFIH